MLKKQSQQCAKQQVTQFFNLISKSNIIDELYSYSLLAGLSLLALQIFSVWYISCDDVQTFV